MRTKIIVKKTIFFTKKKDAIQVGVLTKINNIQFMHQIKKLKKPFFCTPFSDDTLLITSLYEMISSIEHINLYRIIGHQFFFQKKI